MAFDGFVTAAIALSLNSLLSEGKIDKIFQPDKDELIFHIYKDRANYKLFISANSSHPRIHLLPPTYQADNPKEAPAFSMLLRKHFRGARIEEIRQHLSERIVEILVEQKDELGFPKKKQLIIEIMGKHSNITAIDSESGKILDSIKRISPQVNRYRSLLPGIPYVYPPDQGKLPFYNLPDIDFGDRASDILNSVQGVSPAMAEEIFIRSKKENRMASEIINELSSSIVLGNYGAFVYEDLSKFPVDFHIFDLKEKSDLYNRLDFDDLNSCLQYYYSHKDLGNRMRQKSSDLNRHIGNSLSKLYLKKEKLLKDLALAEQGDIHRLYGELLTANLHVFDKGQEKVKVLNYYNGEEVDISLDPRFSPSDNAKIYFKKYNKSKVAQKEKKKQIEESQEAIDYLESVQVFADNATKPVDLDNIRQELISEGFLKRKQKKKETVSHKANPLVFILNDDVSVRVGKNNKENDYLTFKYAGRKDLWFHVKDIPGSHVILSTKNNHPSYVHEADHLEKAAALAAFYSKARNSSNVAVDYTYVSNVKKIPKGKPGMVTYKNFKTLYVDPTDSP